jgi:MFS family permease
MGRQIRLLLGISVFWLALSILLDGVNTLVLPFLLSGFANHTSQATLLGLITFIGLLAGALIQPIAGAFSDKFYPIFSRKGFIGIGLILILLSLLLFASVQNILAILLGYLAIQVSASVAQAGQQGLIPDLIDEHHRGLASGFKGFMDLTGAMLGFVLLGQLLGVGKPLLAIAVIGGFLMITYLIAVFLTPEHKRNQGTIITTHAIPLKKIFSLDLIQHAAFVRLVLARFLFLLGSYAAGRFLLLFVANRLGLPEEQAAEQAGKLLAGLALITVLASPFTGWLADRIGRVPLMIAGAIFSAISALMLIWANSSTHILLFGGLMSIGSAAFAGGSWALLADLVPKDDSARFFGLANFSTAGSSAVAGLFGPVIDGLERIWPGMGYSVLFLGAALAFLASILPIKGSFLKKGRKEDENKTKTSSDTSGLVSIPLSANPAGVEEDQNS